MDEYGLSRLVAKAKRAGVGFSLFFCEADDSFYISVRSHAPSEQWMGKNNTLEIVLEDASIQLDKILGKTDKQSAEAERRKWLDRANQVEKMRCEECKWSTSYPIGKTCTGVKFSCSHWEGK